MKAQIIVMLRMQMQEIHSITYANHYVKNICKKKINKSYTCLFLMLNVDFLIKKIIMSYFLKIHFYIV